MVQVHVDEWQWLYEYMTYTEAREVGSMQKFIETTIEPVIQLELFFSYTDPYWQTGFYMIIWFHNTGRPECAKHTCMLTHMAPWDGQYD